MTGLGRRSAAARWSASTVRNGCSRVSSAARSRQRWSTGTTWMRSQSSRRARRRRSESVGRSQTRSTSAERLGEGEGRRAPVGVGVHRLHDDPAVWTGQEPSEQRGGVERQGHAPRTSRRMRSSRLPVHESHLGRRPRPIATARRLDQAPGDEVVERHVGARRSRSARAGRPAGRRSVITSRCPAPARRTSAVSRPRTSRMPTSSATPATLPSCVHLRTHGDVRRRSWPCQPRRRSSTVPPPNGSPT